MYLNKFLVWHKKFGPAQNIFGPVKGQCTSFVGAASINIVSDTQTEEEKPYTNMETAKNLYKITELQCT